MDYKHDSAEQDGQIDPHNTVSFALQVIQLI